MTTLSPSLVEAYNVANYTVLAAQRFVMKVGCKSDGIEDLYRRLGVKSTAFITAFNPYSKVTDSAENNKRNELLRSDLDEISFAVVKGYGQDPEGSWEKEDSFLAFGISKEQAVQLGIKYEQNAILWCDSDFIPELVFLK